MTDKRNVLFVDDEPRVLQGLQNLLRKRRHEWNMVFANGGDEALQELEKGPFDVIISDMRMPRMDGAALLAEVQRKYPSTVRIVLSGQTDQDMARRTVTVAHQFLAKPCDGDLLKRVIERTVELQHMLTDPALRAAVGQIGQLPALPHIYAQLSHAIESPSSTTASLARIVEQDPSIAAKLLQLVNSAFFGLGTKTSTIAQAINYLGMEILRSLVLLMHASTGLKVDPEVLKGIQSDAMMTARIAQAIAPKNVDRQEAFTAGLLASIGRVVIAARTAKEPNGAADMMNFSHAQIGAYLLGLWNLPFPIIEAVAHHREPQRSRPEALDLPVVVHVADALARTISRREEPTKELDMALLVNIGQAQEVPQWIAEAEQQWQALERRRS